MKLTKTRENWAKSRKEVVFKGTTLNHSVALEERYKRELDRLVKAMCAYTKQELIKLFKKEFAKEYFKEQNKMEKVVYAMDDTISSQARILTNYLQNKFETLFNRKSKSIAESMLNGALKASAFSLGASLKELSGGISFKTSIIPEGLTEVIKASIEENVSLIRSIPTRYFIDIQGSVMRSITTGEGIKELLPEIKKYEGVTLRRAKTIAYDQTRKAYNSINKQRMLDVGIKKFQWIHSGGGQKPRASHLKMNGKIFSFENLDAEQQAMNVPDNDRGLPGHPINCRCSFKPIYEFMA